MRSYTYGIRLVFAFAAASMSSAHSQALSSLQQCLSQNVSGGAILLRNSQVVVDQKVTGSVWVLGCDGQLGRQLWNDLYAYRSGAPNQWKDSNNQTNESFYFGTRSNCTRVLFDAAGRPGSLFYCTVYLDLTDAVLQGLR
jgi:hypothetical protein